MKKKRLLSLLAAVALVCGLVGCQADTDTGQADVSTGQEQISVENSTIIPKVKDDETKVETTSVPQNAEINIETLAEGEERDYKIEDILKNDLEIDGIPISIPCTLNELLETLGDDYSVKKSDIKDSFDGEANIKSKYFTGDSIVVDLYYNDENSYGSIHALATNTKKADYDTINVIGYMGGSGRHNGYLSLSNLNKGDSLDKCIESYGSPNGVDFGINERIYLDYKDDDCFISITIKDNVVIDMWAQFKTEDVKND